MVKLTPRTAYRPALDDHARRLIARIQRDPSDIEAVLALKAHYEAHGDLPSLTNLMQGWAETMREPGAAADAYVSAADAALQTGDRARAHWLYRHALERSPKHAAARARLGALERAPQPAPQPPPVSGIRNVDSNDDSRAREHEDTERMRSDLRERPVKWRSAP